MKRFAVLLFLLSPLFTSCALVADLLQIGDSSSSASTLNQYKDKKHGKKE